MINRPSSSPILCYDVIREVTHDRLEGLPRRRAYSWQGVRGWLVVGTRIPADAVLDNADDGYGPEEIVAEVHPSLPLERAKRILAFVRERTYAPRPA